MSSPTTSFEQDYASRFHGVEIQHGISPDCAGSPYDNEVQARQTAEHVGSLRAQLFAEIESDTQWLDIDAIDDYFQAIGLPRKDFIIVRPRELAVYNRITAQYGWPAYPSPTKEGDFYYGVCPVGTELAVVLWHEEAEAVHGRAFTEGHLVHELAHATSDWNEWTIDRHPVGRTLSARRLGQIVFNIGANDVLLQNGAYLEEAFAASIQTDYLKSRGKKLGYKNYADIAAEGLAHLCAKCPDLFPAMIEARRNVDGLRRVAKYINEIHPGLYAHLQKVVYTEAGFKQATEDIHGLVD